MATISQGGPLPTLQRMTEICSRAGSARSLLGEVCTALDPVPQPAGLAVWLAIPVAPGTYGLVERRDMAEACAPDLLEIGWLGPAAAALLTGEVVVARSPAEIVEHFADLAPVLLVQGHRAALALPLVHDEACLGIILMSFAETWQPSEQDMRELHTVSLLTGQALTRILLQERLRRVPTHDSLTGLPGRIQLVERIVEALARSTRRLSPVGVVVVDLDGFAAVNERWGRAAGDAVLTFTAQRISAAVRDVDFVARLGGDVFVVVCEDGDPDGAATVAARIHRAMAKPMGIQGNLVRVGASLGIAVHHAAVEPTDPEALLAEAEGAMQVAREIRRSS